MANDDMVEPQPEVTDSPRYWCRGCDLTFTTAEASIAHHDATGHFASHRPRGEEDKSWGNSWGEDHEAIRVLAAVYEDHRRKDERIGAFDTLLAHIRTIRSRLLLQEKRIGELEGEATEQGSRVESAEERIREMREINRRLEQINLRDRLQRISLEERVTAAERGAGNDEHLHKAAEMLRELDPQELSAGTWLAVSGALEHIRLASSSAMQSTTPNAPVPEEKTMSERCPAGYAVMGDFRNRVHVNGGDKCNHATASEPETIERNEGEEARLRSIEMLLVRYADLVDRTGSGNLGEWKEIDDAYRWLRDYRRQVFAPNDAATAVIDLIASLRSRLTSLEREKGESGWRDPTRTKRACRTCKRAWSGIESSSVSDEAHDA